MCIGLWVQDQTDDAVVSAWLSETFAKSDKRDVKRGSWRSGYRLDGRIGRTRPKRALLQNHCFLPASIIQYQTG